ncbi:hypothetical protein C8T65DRAFT_72125 [Cerioporus squamosus]|nr:hypothetical protein C8T65DRAFT_72125 [Cerioporus squamosus]
MSYSLQRQRSRYAQAFHLEDADDTPRMSAILPANRATTFPALSTVTHVYLHMRHAHYTMQVSLESDLVPSIYVTTTLALVSDDIEDWENYLESCGLWDLVEIFAGTPLTYLSIEGDFDSVMGPDWKTAFLAFPTLEVLKCEASDESSPTAVWAALALDAAAQEILCPRLRRITMHGCRMEGRGKADVFFEKMFACLTSRAAGGGTRLQKLDLEVQSLGEELDAKLKRKYPADLLGSVDVVKFRLKG